MKKLFYLASWESFIAFSSTARPLPVVTLTHLQLVHICLHCDCEDTPLAQLKALRASGSKGCLNPTEQMYYQHRGVVYTAQSATESLLLC